MRSLSERLEAMARRNEKRRARSQQRLEAMARENAEKAARVLRSIESQRRQADFMEAYLAEMKPRRPKWPTFGYVISCFQDYLLACLMVGIGGVAVVLVVNFPVVLTAFLGEMLALWLAVMWFTKRPNTLIFNMLEVLIRRFPDHLARR